MSRVGFSDNDSDAALGRMLPLAEPTGDTDENDRDEVELPNQRYIYENEAQSKRRRYRCRETYEVAGRGTGKTTDIAEHVKETSMRIPRSSNVFLGCSIKQLYIKTWPAVVKGLEMMGLVEGRDFMRQRPPAKLHWPLPLSKPRSWENVTIFNTGACWYSISMAVRASVNGMTLSSAAADETRYLPFLKMKEELFPAIRPELISKGSGLMGDGFRNTAKYTFGYNVDYNPLYLSKFFVSDPSITQKQALWEQEELSQTDDINHEIDVMLAEADEMPELWHIDGFLKRLNELRCKSKIFFRFSSLSNIEILGEEWFRTMQRTLPPLMYEIQILGRRKGLARDGYYCNFDLNNNGYSPSDSEVMNRILSNYTTHYSRQALDQANNLTSVEYEAIDLNRTSKLDDATLDVDLELNEPLRIAVDCNANINCMVVGQTRVHQGRAAVMVLKEFFVQNEVRLRGLVKMFNSYYAIHRRRGCGEVIFYYTPTIKQGGAAAYAVEDSEDFRFDHVIISELESYGWSVTPAEFPVWRQERKYQFLNDCLAFRESPSIFICRDQGRCEYLITAIENAGVLPGTFRKDKSREKLKNSEPESAGGDPRTRTDITDAFDDLVIGIKERAETRKKIGGGLRNRFKNLAGIPRG